MPDPTPDAAGPTADTAERKAADARARAAVEQRLAAAPATANGRLTLADGQTLSWRSHAEFIPVPAEGLGAASGEPQAAVFTIGYFADPPARPDGGVPAPRPVCFAFNGGPGSSSVWLHLGALGPKRVRILDDGTMPPPPYAVEDNPLSWLAHFDLVFVDPPHTGFSLSASDAARRKLLSVDGDVAALTEVVRTWVARHRRHGSPLYLAGESYGTTRGAAMAERLHDAGVVLSGVVLVSCALDLQALEFLPRNDLPYALFLPAFAHVAQYHGLLTGPLAASPRAAREAAEAFVAEEYLAALHAGARLDGARRDRIARRVAELTGLKRELVEARNLRISDATYFVEALRDRGQILGRLEARVCGPMGATRGRDWEFDPGMEALNGPYTHAAMGWFAELGLGDLHHYQVFSGAVNDAWDWQRARPHHLGYVSTGDALARAMRRNPHLRVLVASGRTDLGTPYSASDWSLAQLDAPPEVLARITHHHYDAGHMMYTRPEDLRALHDDLAAWLRA